MNVNTAVLTDVVAFQSTAPLKDNGKSAEESSGKNFQQVMEQYTGRKETVRKETVKKENGSAETQKTPVTDQETVTAKKDDGRTNSRNKSLSGSQNSQNEKLPKPAVPEEEQKTEEVRLQAMLALAEPVVVQVISPEMLMEVVGNGTVENQNMVEGKSESGLNVQPMNQEILLEPVKQETVGIVQPELMADAKNQGIMTDVVDQEMLAVNSSQNSDHQGINSVFREMDSQMPVVETPDTEAVNAAKMSDQPVMQLDKEKSPIHDTAATDSRNQEFAFPNQEAEPVNISDSSMIKPIHAEMTEKQTFYETANQVVDQNLVGPTGQSIVPETLNGVLRANNQNLVNQPSVQNQSEKLSTGEAAVQSVPEFGDLAQADTIKSQIDARGAVGELPTTSGRQSELSTPKSQIDVPKAQANVSEKDLSSQAASRNPGMEAAGKAAGQEITPKTSQWDMASKTADENLQPASQSRTVIQEQPAAVQLKESQLHESVLSETAQGTTASQAPVVSDTAVAAGKTSVSQVSDQTRQTTTNAVSAEQSDNTVIRETATASTSSQSSTADDTESGFADMLKKQSALNGTSRAASKNEADPVKEQVSALSEEQASLEELKKNAEAKGINLMDRMAAARITGGAKVQTINQTAGQNASSVVTQVKEGVEQGVKNQLKEFTIHLKPEGLGEVIVKMVSQDGKLTVNIGASSSETQKLINSQMVSLKEMLEPLHAEVGEVYHSSQDATGFLNYDQNTPENQRQQAGHYRASQHYDNYTEDEEILTEAEYITAQRNLARLYTYV